MNDKTMSNATTNTILAEAHVVYVKRTLGQKIWMEILFLFDTAAWIECLTDEEREAIAVQMP